MKTAILAITATALTLGVGNALAGHVSPVLHDNSTGLTRTQQARMEKFASASLFGQFRSSMADFLWLKVDKYLHNGVDLRATTNQEKDKVSTDTVQSADREDGNRSHHGDETTVVPSAQHDWRGLLGSVERNVAPYKDMAHHKHAEAKEALPLFRLMAWSNPRFIPAYITGASLLASEKRTEEAVVFLAEGEKNNPESIEIQTAFGETLMFRKRDWAGSLPHLQKAIVLAAARDPQTLNEDEREAWEGAYRWMVLNRREAGDPQGARQAAQAGLRLFPNDVVCRRYLSGAIAGTMPRS